MERITGITGYQDGKIKLKITLYLLHNTYGCACCVINIASKGWASNSLIITFTKAKNNYIYSKANNITKNCEKTPSKIRNPILN